MSLIEHHVTNCYARRTHANTESSQYIENTNGCYLIIKIYTEDTTGIGRHMVVTRRHRTVINMTYKHYPVLGVNKIKIRTLCLAAYTIICDLRIYIYIYFLILTQSNLSDMLLCTNFNFNFIAAFHTTLIIYHRQYNYSRF